MLQAVQRCRWWASALSANRLVFYCEISMQGPELIVRDCRGYDTIGRGWDCNIKAAEAAALPCFCIVNIIYSVSYLCILYSIFSSVYYIYSELCIIIIIPLFVDSGLYEIPVIIKKWIQENLLIHGSDADTWKLIIDFAKLSSSSSSSPVELSTALILIISTHPHPPTHPRDSSNETLLGYLGRWNLVWKLYSTKVSKLGNYLAPS